MTTIFHTTISLSISGLQRPTMYQIKGNILRSSVKFGVAYTIGLVLTQTTSPTPWTRPDPWPPIPYYSDYDPIKGWEFFIFPKGVFPVKYHFPFEVVSKSQRGLKRVATVQCIWNFLKTLLHCLDLLLTYRKSECNASLSCPLCVTSKPCWKLLSELF